MKHAMDEPENNRISSRDVVSALLVLVFVWGSLWVGSRGFVVPIDIDKAQAAVAGGLETVSTIFDSLLAGTFTAKTIVINPSESLLTGNIEDRADLPAQTRTKLSTADDLDKLTMVIGGDLMLDRGVRKLGQDKGYEKFFSGIVDLLKSADLAIANLEGPITTYPSKTLLSNGKISPELTFTFAPETAKALATVGFDALSLANNHTANFGQKGLDETRGYLKKAGVAYFGSPANTASSTLLLEKNGFRLALVGYHAFSSGFEGISDNIRDLNNRGYFVIVMPHWGEEYATSSTADQKAKARLMVAAGAKAIFGAHPHVVMEHSLIGDVPVFYSLGNLLFDQYFSPEVLNGNLVKITLAQGSKGPYIESIQIYEISTDSREGLKLIGQAVDF